MHISKLKIKNFKCFEEVEIDFDPDFNLIIGKNNSGKSTIFEAIRLWHLAIQQFFSKRTGKKGDGSENISFYKKYQFEPLAISDLSFLRIDNLTTVLNKKVSIKEQEDIQEIAGNTFSIELTFEDKDNIASIPITFRPSEKNILRCRIGLNKELTLDDLKNYSHSLSNVISLANNDSFINRIRLAYIPPKFTLPNTEALLSDNNAFILEKLIMGESQFVIRNILHHWSEFSYQTKTKDKGSDTIEKAIKSLEGIISEEVFKSNFEKIKPYIEDVLEYEIKLRKNVKSKFLKIVEDGLENIVKQKFNFGSENNPVHNYILQIKDKYNNSEISQLGSGTINVLNILTVLNYNDQTVENATKCNLLLLDEPDSHLQFNLQFELFNYLKGESEKQSKQIFIISHNSSLISQFDKLLFIDYSKKVIAPISIDYYIENHLKNIDDNHYNVLKSLSDAKREKDILNNQLNDIKNFNIPLIYTEGPSDMIILENAFKKLYPTCEIPFNLTNGFSCTQLKNTFENSKIFEKNTNIQIALFDFDTAFSNWNGLWNGNEKKSFTNNELNPFKTLTKKHNKYNGYAMLLPVPQIEKIKVQVLDPDNLNLNFGDKSVLQIEHLFYDVIPLNDSFETKNIVGGGKCIYFKGDKMVFAKKTKNLSMEDFKHFIPLFEKIAEIINFSLPKVEFNA